MTVTRKVNPYRWRPRLVLPCNAYEWFAFACVLNFFVFMLVSMALGGDAGNGKVAHGHYFVGNHGRYDEVSKPVFTYSLVHGLSLFVTHPLGAVFLFLGRKERKRRGRAEP